MDEIPVLLRASQTGMTEQTRTSQIGMTGKIEPNKPK